MTRPKHDSGKPDTRYTVTKEYDGHVTPRYVARFADQRIGSTLDKRDAWALCQDHQRQRQEATV
jgi:hypothetical protein